MVLVKKLSKIGNSFGVILSAEVLRIAGVDPKRECEIDVSKNGIVLRPYFKNDKRDKKVMEAMEKFIRQYRYDLQKLA